MTKTAQVYRRRGEAGSAFIELGLFFPVLLLLLLGAIDFSRVYFARITLINAAEVGAQYGSRTVTASSDTSGMITAASNDASDLTGVTATAAQSCTCSGTSQACSGTCGGDEAHLGNRQHILHLQSAV